jgi:uroporphyrinogen-III synthase
VRIALTHSGGRLEALAPALRELGHEVVHTPVIATAPLLDDATRRAAALLVGLPWRCYPSRSAVEAWSALGLPFDDGARLAAVGSGTAAALHAAGAARVLTPERAAANAAGLASAVLAAGARGAEVGLVQGRRARPELESRLRAGGALPRRAIVYAVMSVPWSSDVGFDAVLLASPSAVAALPDDVARRGHLVALGPTTAAAVRDRGWSCHQASEPTVAGALAALTRVAARTPQGARELGT